MKFIYLSFEKSKILIKNSGKIKRKLSALKLEIQKILISVCIGKKIKFNLNNHKY